MSSAAFGDRTPVDCITTHEMRVFKHAFCSYD
jgi:hypothetical protein